jgi:hypothetical protein
MIARICALVQLYGRMNLVTPYKPREAGIVFAPGWISTFNFLKQLLRPSRPDPEG